jgi:hypothetical protein
MPIVSMVQMFLKQLFKQTTCFCHKCCLRCKKCHRDVLHKILYLSATDLRFRRHACTRVISFANETEIYILFLESTLLYVMDPFGNKTNLIKTFRFFKIFDISRCCSSLVLIFESKHF